MLGRSEEVTQGTPDEGAKGHFFCSVAELIRIGDKSKLTRSDICDVCKCILVLENNEVAPTGVYSK